MEVHGGITCHVIHIVNGLLHVAVDFPLFSIIAKVNEVLSHRIFSSQVSGVAAICTICCHVPLHPSLSSA
jgi:hypothetical protein